MSACMKMVKENWVVITAIVIVAGYIMHLWLERSSYACKLKEKFAPYPSAVEKTPLMYLEKRAPQPYEDPASHLRSVDSDLADRPSVKREDWVALAPPDAHLREKQFLSPEKFIGVDTVANTNKNANYDLRSAPPNPRVDAGPWNISTFERDSFRRPLE